MLKIAYHPIYCHPLPKGHRFPMLKYELLPQQLIYEGTCTQDNFFEPVRMINEAPILSVHDPEYFYELLNITLNQRAARKIGFPLSEVLVEREITIADGLYNLLLVYYCYTTENRIQFLVIAENNLCRFLFVVLE